MNKVLLSNRVMGYYVFYYNQLVNSSTKNMFLCYFVFFYLVFINSSLTCPLVHSSTKSCSSVTMSSIILSSQSPCPLVYPFTRLLKKSAKTFEILALCD